MTAGEIHIWDNPGQLSEQRHKDGGASILHLNITLFGLRALKCFTNQTEHTSRSWGLAPGTVYFGILTSPEHQVSGLVDTLHALRQIFIVFPERSVILAWVHPLRVSILCCWHVGLSSVAFLVVDFVALLPF